eukprot:851467-Rhodomonas_salina.1
MALCGNVVPSQPLGMHGYRPRQGSHRRTEALRGEGRGGSEIAISQLESEQDGCSGLSNARRHWGSIPQLPPAPTPLSAPGCARGQHDAVLVSTRPGRGPTGGVRGGTGGVRGGEPGRLQRRAIRGVVERESFGEVSGSESV